MSSSVDEGWCTAVCKNLIESWHSFSKAKRAFLSVVTLLLLVFVFETVSPALRMWMHDHETKVPEEIVGMWTTDASSYEGRYLRINGHYLATKFDVDELPSVQEVDKIKTEQSGPIRDYNTFLYRPDRSTWSNHHRSRFPNERRDTPWQSEADRLEKTAVELSLIQGGYRVVRPTYRKFPSVRLGRGCDF